MPDLFRLKLRDDVEVQSSEGGTLLVCRDGSVIRIQHEKPGLDTLLSCLQQGCRNGEAAVDVALQTDPAADPMLLQFALATLHTKGFLSYTLTHSGSNLATLVPTSEKFCWRTTDVQNRTFRLSRFVWLRPEGGHLVLECALSHAVIRLYDLHVANWIGQLARPRTTIQLTASLPLFDADTSRRFIMLLVAMNAAFPCDEAGSISEDNDTVLQQWEPHDLLFHTRTRSGRHNTPYGATYRFANLLPHTSAYRTLREEPGLSLPRPESNQLPDANFFDVVEARRSIRDRGENSITLKDLSYFLWFVARVKSFVPSGSLETERYDATLRPVASAGAMHEIEFYLTVNRCDGLQQGMYRYLANDHSLEQVAALGLDQQRLLSDAQRAAGLLDSPDILITLASRFNRISWKYQAIAYALTLKNVGVLYGHMYLVATALRLAPCALGGGNAEHFMDAAGVDYYEEGSVGEFLLSAQS